MEKNKQLTPMQELIEELTNIKETKCSLLSEVLFFDGILAIIEGKQLLLKEKQVIEDAFEDGFEIGNDVTFDNYYNNKFNND